MRMHGGFAIGQKIGVCEIDEITDPIGRLRALVLAEDAHIGNKAPFFQPGETTVVQFFVLENFQESTLVGYLSMSSMMSSG